MNQILLIYHRVVAAFLEKSTFEKKSIILAKSANERKMKWD